MKCSGNRSAQPFAACTTSTDTDGSSASAAAISDTATSLPATSAAVEAGVASVSRAMRLSCSRAAISPPKYTATVTRSRKICGCTTSNRNWAAGRSWVSGRSRWLELADRPADAAIAVSATSMARNTGLREVTRASATPRNRARRRGSAQAGLGPAWRVLVGRARRRRSRAGRSERRPRARKAGKLKAARAPARARAASAR